MTDLDAQIVAVLALDEKRTPGNWAVCTEPKNEYWNKGKTVYGGSAEDNCGMRVCDTCEGYTGTHPEYGDCEVGADAAFIAAAPLMATIIRQLAAERAADAADAAALRSLMRGLEMENADKPISPDVAFIVGREIAKAAKLGANLYKAMPKGAAITSAGGTTDE